MNYFIFQAVDKTYDLLSQLQPGNTVQWTATRYRARMETGDIVFLWRGGDASIRGVYGWGQISGTPYAREKDGEFRVPVTYQCRLANHIPIADIRNDTRLLSMQILSLPVGANFQINLTEARALASYFPVDNRPLVGV